MSARSRSIIALGGSDTDMSPAVKYFADLHKNQPIVPKQTSYARVVSGEIPILFDYDFNAYRAKYGESGNFVFVIPCEGTVVFPYVTSLVKNAPDKDKAEKVLDYFLSDKGQAMWANAYLRPARPIELPQAVKSKFLPDSRLRPRQERRLGQDGSGAERLHGALPRRRMRMTATEAHRHVDSSLLPAARHCGHGVFRAADGAAGRRRRRRPARAESLRGDPHSIRAIARR